MLIETFNRFLKQKRPSTRLSSSNAIIERDIIIGMEIFRDESSRGWTPRDVAKIINNDDVPSSQQSLLLLSEGLEEGGKRW